MTRPADEQPTTVLPQQTVEQPSVVTGSETRRARTWHSRIPARIGRARSSTVIIGALFVLLGGLNVALPQRDGGTTEVTLENGEKIVIPTSSLPSELRTPTPSPDPTPPAPTSAVPAPTSAAPTGTPAPSPTPDDEEPTTSPAPAATPRSTAPTTSAPTSTTGGTTTQAPATSGAVPSTRAVPSTAPAPTGTIDPTG